MNNIRIRDRLQAKRRKAAASHAAKTRWERRRQRAKNTDEPLSPLRKWLRGERDIVALLPIEPTTVPMLEIAWDVFGNASAKNLHLTRALLSRIGYRLGGRRLYGPCRALEDAFIYDYFDGFYLWRDKDAKKNYRLQIGIPKGKVALACSWIKQRLTLTYLMWVAQLPGQDEAALQALYEEMDTRMYDTRPRLELRPTTVVSTSSTPID